MTDALTRIRNNMGWVFFICLIISLIGSSSGLSLPAHWDRADLITLGALFGAFLCGIIPGDAA